MKTNISIELNDEQRLNLGQKYHNSKAKKMITRKELGHSAKVHRASRSAKQYSR